MIIYQVLFRILEHICSFFFLLWAMDMLFRCGDRNRRQTLIPFRYLTIVKYSVSPDVFLRKHFIRSTNSSLFVHDKHTINSILELRSVVHATLGCLCVYSARYIFYFRIDVGTYAISVFPSQPTSKIK